MSFLCPVEGCDRYATEWSICRSCASRLASDLATIPFLAVEVGTTLARQGAQAARGGSRSAVAPLPYDPRASAARGALKGVLVGWVQVLAEDSDCGWPADEIGACADWLAARIGELRTHPAAGDVAAEIRSATAACWRVIDLAPDRFFAGPCEECGSAMYARPEAISVWCSSVGCRATYDVAERRARMLDAARDQLLSIPEMLRALPGLVGHELNDATLRQWHHRGRMLPHGLTPTGRETFRVGDVLDLLHDRRTA